MSALSDVARIAEVSKATASRALSGRGYVSAETRDRVVSAAAAIGYVVSANAASLVTGRTRNVGVVIPHINRWFFGEVLEGIEEALVAAGYDLTLYQLSADPTERRRVFEYFLVRKRVDAVIAVGIELNAHELQLLHALTKPVAAIGGPIEGIATLSIDDVAAARTVTDHLISLGHVKLLHLGGDQRAELDFRVHADRRRGYLMSTIAARLPGAFRAIPLTIPGGYTAALNLLGNPRTRPTGIVAGSDEVAIGAILAARQLGIRVPEELSVVGIDGHELAEMFDLTTLEQHPRGQGALAVDLVMAELSATGPSSDAPRWRAYPAQLVVRGSTAVPGASVGVASAPQKTGR